MRMMSVGAQRKKKWEVHFTENDFVTKPTVTAGDVPNLRVWIHGRRRFVLTLTPTDVVKFLLNLPPESIAGALTEVGHNVDLATQLPEVLKQLVAGALARAEEPSPLG